MCGIFGFVGGGKVSLAELGKIAVLTECERGGHAFGWAWIDDNYRLRSFKAPGRLADNSWKLDMLQGARMVIGHVRWATNGRPENNGNNHPHSSDGGWIVHNGTVSRIKQLMNTEPTSSDCDSEIIARLVEVSKAKTLEGRVREAVEDVADDGSPHAVAGIWKEPHRQVVLARAGKPLSYRLYKGGAVYFASLAEHLGKGAIEMPDNSTCVLTETGPKFAKAAKPKAAPKGKKGGIGDAIRELRRDQPAGGWDNPKRK